MIHLLKKIERTLGSAKFAVVIILLFTACLIYGTFMESYHGTEYANRLVYKSLPFFFIQFMMFLSIFFATLLRLPLKKRLYGFYVLHLGLLTLFVGSFVTFYSGIDGNLTLPPNVAQRKIVVNEDEFEIRLIDKEIKLTSPMPFYATETMLNYKVETPAFKEAAEIELIRFLPFAVNTTQWIDSPANAKNDSSAQYQIYNERFSETFILSLNPYSEFQSSTKMGLLNIHYMPKEIYPCFALNPKSKTVIWNTQSKTCFTPEQRGLKLGKTEKGQKHYQLKQMGKTYHFFPEISPLPMTQKVEIIKDAPYRIFSLGFFEKKPHLFSFGKKIAYYDKDDEAWQGHDFDEESIASLPWMGFELRLMQYHEKKYPVKTPTAVTPIQDNGKVIVGDDKAIEVRVNGENYWLRQSDGPMQLVLNGRKLGFELKKKEILLPYELILDRFVMKTDPGTNNPASYESFVSLFTGKGNQKHHIFMNNPLKHDNFTFYQASYFEAQSGGYGSVISVNFDPGRPIKYFGSILLVLGCIWHFGFANRKKKIKTEKVA